MTQFLKIPLDFPIAKFLVSLSKCFAVVEFSVCLLCQCLSLCVGTYPAVRSVAASWPPLAGTAMAPVPEPGGQSDCVHKCFRELLGTRDLRLGSIKAHRQSARPGCRVARARATAWRAGPTSGPLEWFHQEILFPSYENPASISSESSDVICLFVCLWVSALNFFCPVWCSYFRNTPIY